MPAAHSSRAVVNVRYIAEVIAYLSPFTKNETGNKRRKIPAKVSTSTMLK